MTERIDTSAARATGAEAEHQREEGLTGPTAGLGVTEQADHTADDTATARDRADETTGEPSAANAAARRASGESAESGSG